MMWRFIVALLATFWMLGCGETTVQPFVDKPDASVDAGDDDAGEDDDSEEDAGEEDAGEDEGSESELSLRNRGTP
ncbi:MAG: hypothetical protein KJO40_04975 [Deltaproteobacteria bacterium]|nr:hypothetical protein [Deltaproteobacteria bacterium]MBT8464769.1 hypothetical protein [Deltaproteobacteria bacterium]NNK06700.1 hypothetical protein [Myxococcales bacterium]NNK41175.1 hypothetical protein [Myxococcales bacterium]RZV52446.1 MAG: hypothetical protein EX268_11975 [Deltaproteobacteria bacterium]